MKFYYFDIQPKFRVVVAWWSNDSRIKDHSITVTVTAGAEVM